MNKPTSYILGALIGGGLGYVIGTVIVDNLYPEYEEVERTLIEDNEMKNEARFEAARTRILSKPTPKLKKGAAVPAINYNAVATTKTLGQLKELSAKYRKDGQTEELEATVEITEPVEPNAPYVITDEDYGSQDEYDAISLHYYVLDDTMTDGSDQLVPSYEDIVGGGAVDSFGVASNDPELVYIRSPKFKCDYEIIRIQESYTKAVLGLQPEPTKTQKIRNRNEEVED